MHKVGEDDLFRESTMTFGEHLEELRIRLFRAAIWLAVGVAIGFLFGDRVVKFIEKPLVNALREYLHDRAKKKLEEKYGGTLSPEQTSLLGTGYVPDQFFIEPTKVFGSLADSDSELSKQAPKPHEYHFSPADIADGRAKSLAVALDSAAKDETAKTPAARLWQKLDKAGRVAVGKLAASTDASPDPVQLGALAQSVDRVLKDRELYDPAYFRSAYSSDLQALIDRRDKLDDEELRRMNWMLLYEELPDEILAPHPYLAQITVWRPSGEVTQLEPKSMSPTEAFMIYLKAAMLSGFILFSPLIFRELWMFVAAGLYPHERRYVHIFLPFSVGLFISGAAVAFFMAFPPVLRFLFSYNTMLGIEPDTRISEWMSFVLFLPLMFGLGFQLPLVMLFMNRIGLVTVAMFWKQWRVAVLVIFITATILTPSPDPYSLLLMATPMTALYFGGIMLCTYASRRRPAGLGGE